MGYPKHEPGFAYEVWRENLSRHIGRGVSIAARSYIGAQTVIEDGAQIGDDVSLERAHIGKNVVLENTYVMAGTRIGEGAVIKHSVLGENCQIGKNFQTRDHTSSNIKIPVKGEYIKTGKKDLGCFLGHEVKVAPNLFAQPGKIVYNHKLVTQNITQHLLPLKAILIDADNTLYPSRQNAPQADRKAMAYLAAQTKYQASPRREIKPSGVPDWKKAGDGCPLQQVR